MIRFWTRLSIFIAAVIYRVSATRGGPLSWLTDDPVFERLVIFDRFAITIALIFFTIEILNRLVIQQTVCVDATRDLKARFQPCVQEDRMGGQTVSRSFIARRSRVRQRVRRTLTTTEKAWARSQQWARYPKRTVSRQDDENNKWKRPVKLDHKHYKCHNDIDKCGDNVE
jgi:hypothetical protein